MSNVKWTKQSLLEEARKYSTRQEFRKGNQSAYNAIAYRKMKDEAFAHMPKMAPRKWTTEALKLEIAKYSTKADFRNANPHAYYAVKNRGLLDDLLAHMPNIIETNRIPLQQATTGIYLLLKAGKIVYVGKSSNCIRSRLYHHTSPVDKEFKDIDTISVYAMENTANIDVVEIYLINKYQPVYNTLCNSSHQMTVHIDNLDKVIDTEHHFTKESNDNFKRN